MIGALVTGGLIAFALGIAVGWMLLGMWQARRDAGRIIDAAVQRVVWQQDVASPRMSSKRRGSRTTVARGSSG